MDIFDDDNSVDDDLCLANTEFQQNLKSIENAAFHDGFEVANKKVLQDAFDAGYIVIFEMFSILSNLESIHDVLVHFVETSSEKPPIELVKMDFKSIYNRLFDEYQTELEQDIQNKACMSKGYNTEHIKPSDDTLNQLDTIKSKLTQYCEILNLTNLCKQIDTVCLNQNSNR